MKQIRKREKVEVRKMVYGEGYVHRLYRGGDNGEEEGDDDCDFDDVCDEENDDDENVGNDKKG
jgi:hypothetical protein